MRLEAGSEKIFRHDVNGSLPYFDGDADFHRCTFVEPQLKVFLQSVHSISLPKKGKESGAGRLRIQTPLTIQPEPKALQASCPSHPLHTSPNNAGEPDNISGLRVQTPKQNLKCLKVL